MSYEKSRFDSLVRIDHKQLDWLRKNKVCRTMAGQLDIIINDYKKYGPKNKKQKMPNLRSARTETKTLGVRTLPKNNTTERIQPIPDRPSGSDHQIN